MPAGVMSAVRQVCPVRPFSVFITMVSPATQNRMLRREGRGTSWGWDNLMWQFVPACKAAAGEEDHASVVPKRWAANKLDEGRARLSYDSCHICTPVKKVSTSHTAMGKLGSPHWSYRSWGGARTTRKEDLPLDSR